MQKVALGWRRDGKRIGFVPTMGFLHEGHMSLVRLARAEADIVVVSIFVNPTQFGPNEDYERYPHDLARDRELCRQNGVDVIFHPSAGDMYSSGPGVFVAENDLSGRLCGAFRPGHFRGVLTVVAKLFNLVLPDAAVFGQKDAQQAILVRNMVRDLNFPVKTIIIAPIVREADGLAMSSRNSYLGPDERKRARCLSAALKTARGLYRAGESGCDALKKAMRRVIEGGKPEAIDYIEIVAERDLKPIDKLAGNCLIALAVRIGRTRLIDNLPLPDDRLGNLPEE